MASPRVLHAILATLCSSVVFASCARETAGPDRRVATVIVTPAIDTLKALGQVHGLQAVAQDAGGNTLSGQTFVWRSSNASAASVDAVTGMVRAVAAGTTRITASIGDVSGSAEVVVAQEVASVTVTPATAALSAIGATQAFTAEARDVSGAVIPDLTFIWLSSNHNVATISTTGLATAVGPGTVTITAAAQGIPGTAELSVTQAAATLVFNVQPTNLVAGEAISSAVQIEIQDANGALVTGARDPVTLVIGVNPARGTLAGTTTVHAVGGIATFAGLSIDKAGTGYALAASAGGLASATSASFDVSPGPATQLAFIRQPGIVTPGVVITPSVQVAVEDPLGNVVTGAITNVAMAIATGPGGARLGGTTIVSTLNGVASFTDLVLTTAGHYVLVATASRLTPGTSVSFRVDPAAPVQLVFITPPSDAEGTLAISPAVQAAIEDQFGNTVTTATDLVAVALGADPGGATLSGTTTARAIGGIATFPVLSLDRPGDGYTLVATSGVLPPVTSAPFAVHLTLASISAGGQHTCGITAPEVAYCWGGNGVGQLGDGTLTGRTSPVPVQVGLTFGALTAGGRHTCALTGSGFAYCWGANNRGQLGDGTLTNRATPVAVMGALKFVQLSAGENHTCGVDLSHVAYCWGSNIYGQLGDGTLTDRTAPVRVGGPPGLTFERLGAGAHHTCALTAGGVVYCWGDNSSGQLGDGSRLDHRTPAPITGGVTLTALSAGGFHNCGLTAAGAAYCWGNNNGGRLGDGSSTNRTSPVRVTGGLTFSALSAGSDHTCGLAPPGVAYCWGVNTSGQLGDGTAVGETRPVAAISAVLFSILTANAIVDVVGPPAHSCALTAVGAAYCWGSNVSGQLGDGTTSTSYVPVRVVQ